MNVVLHIPDDLAASLGEAGAVERQALEALAVEAYRADRQTKAELRRMLGLRGRFEVDAFLKAHDVRSGLTRAQVDPFDRFSPMVALPIAMTPASFVVALGMTTRASSKAAVEKLSISLTPEFAADIRGAIAAGEYASTSEVIRDALRTWKQARGLRATAIEELSRIWREGVESGDTAPLDAEDIKRRGRARLAAMRDPSH